MLDHIHALDHKVEVMTAVLNRLGVEMDNTELPSLDALEIDMGASPERPEPNPMERMVVKAVRNN
jgi:hypothetical protein